MKTNKQTIKKDYSLDYIKFHNNINILILVIYFMSKAKGIPQHKIKSPSIISKIICSPQFIPYKLPMKKIIVPNTLFWNRMRKLRPHLLSYWSSLQLRPRNIGNINVCESSSAKGNASAGSLRIIGKYLWMCCDYGSTKNSSWCGDRISERLSVPAYVSTAMFLF